MHFTPTSFFSMSTRRMVLAGAAFLPWLIGARRAEAATAHADTSLVQNIMANGRFVTFQPTALKAVRGQLTQASGAAILADLEMLRPWFDGLITYGAYNGNERVPDLAADLGFRAVIMGVWDPSDVRETANALAAWRRHPNLVAGLSVGNEIVFGNRGTWSNLLGRLNAIKAEAPGLALAVSEPFAEYLDHPEARPVLDATDFMLVNIHPVFESWFKSGTADNWTDFVVRVLGRLQAIYSRPILVKETGIPTGPRSAGYDEAMQRVFYDLLARRLPPSRACAFSYFTAFDEPWRTGDFNPIPGAHPEEAFWGLFTDTRVPKPIMADLSRLPK